VTPAHALNLGLLVVTGLGVSLLACSEPVPQLAPASAQPSSAPVLRPDGLEEGTLDAFGLKMPARTAVKRATPSTMVMEVPANSQRTLEYIRARLLNPDGQADQKKTVFEEVEFAAAPGKKFRVVVKPTSMTTEVTIRREPEAQPAGSAPSVDESLANDPRATPEAVASFKAANPDAVPASREQVERPTAIKQPRP
jgi:hypothetical protein